MDMAKTYTPGEFEQRIYDEWQKNEYFKANDTFKKYTIEKLSKFLIEEYKDLSLSFCDYVNVNIKL